MANEAAGPSHGAGVDRLELAIGPYASPAGRPPDSRRPLHCRMSWRLAGHSAQDLDGLFRLRLFAQAVGRRFSCPLGEVQVAAQPGRRDYAAELLVAPGSLPGRDDHPDHPGWYDITAVLRYRGRSAAAAGEFGAAAQQQVRLR